MPDEPPSDDIMRATYRALCKHGYADVTMQDIAAESEKSKSALHYHYERKHDLLVAFLDDLLDAYTSRLDAVDADAPVGRLFALVDTALEPPADGPDREFRTAVLEMKAQAPYDDDIRERLVQFDRALADRVEETLANGVADGTLRADLDVHGTADFVVTVVHGAQTRRVAIGRSVDQTRATLERFVESDVLADDAVEVEA